MTEQEIDTNDMFYYRIFGTNPVKITFDELQECLDDREIPLMAIEMVSEEDADDPNATFEEILLCDLKGNEVATLVWDDIKTSDILGQELDEFREMISDYKPEVNRSWLLDFFDSVTCCYAFALSESAFETENWEALAELTDVLRLLVEGIEQSDSGPVTNETGDIVLDIVDSEGEKDAEYFPCRVALREDGEWNTFEVQTAEEYEQFLNR